jgi:hypothetical protein
VDELVEGAHIYTRAHTRTHYTHAHTPAHNTVHMQLRISTLSHLLLHMPHKQQFAGAVFPHIRQGVYRNL